MSRMRDTSTNERLTAGEGTGDEGAGDPGATGPVFLTAEESAWTVCAENASTASKCASGSERKSANPMREMDAEDAAVVALLAEGAAVALLADDGDDAAAPLVLPRPLTARRSRDGAIEGGGAADKNETSAG